MGHSTLYVFDPCVEVYERSKGLSEGTDYLNIREVPTLTLEHFMMDKLEQPPGTSKGRHQFVALSTDWRHMSYRHHSNRV